MQLEQLEQRTNHCKICFKPINTVDFHTICTKNPTICHDCLILLKPALNEFYFQGVKCLNIYFYNEKIQELLYQFKGCRDYELKTVFFEYYKNYLNHKFKGYTKIPAPSVIDNDKERGFNHVIEMFDFLKCKENRCIHKIKQIKQADLTTKERKKISQFLTIDNVDLRKQKILLIDDVFTTGSTINAMINLVKEKGAREIKVLVMSKTIDLEDRI